MFTLATGRKARPDDQDRAGLPTYPHFSTFVHNFGFLRMLCVVARMAQRHKVFRIIRAFRMIFQMLNVMNLCSLPLPSVSPAVLAHVFISSEDPLPHYLPARSLVKIVVFVIECHSFLHSKADHRSDGPPLFRDVRLYQLTTGFRKLSCYLMLTYCPRYFRPKACSASPCMWTIRPYEYPMLHAIASKRSSSIYFSFSSSI